MRGDGGLGKNLETLVVWTDMRICSIARDGVRRGRHLQKLGEECLFKAIAMK